MPTDAKASDENVCVPCSPPSASRPWPAAAARRPPRPKPALQVSTEIKSLMWVGNSFFYYNNSMHGHTGQLLTASGAKGLRASSITISGSGINWHDVEAYFNPGMASYSFVGDNEVRFNSFDKPFDGVMMMDCSQCPIHPQLQAIFFEYAAKHSATARKHGAAPILFMSWAYQDKPEMTAAAGRRIHQGRQAEQRAGGAGRPGLRASRLPSART